MNAGQPLTLGRGVRCAAARGRDRVAIAWGGETIRYGTLVGRMARLGNAARARFGIEPGDRVALIAPNCPSYFEIVLGLSDLGATVATLNPRLTLAELTAIVADCDPKLVIIHPHCVELTGAADGRPVLTIDAGYETLLDTAVDTIALPVVAETAPFALAYTSGTTGRPKGVLLSHRSRALTALGMAAEYGCFGVEDRFLALTPLCHGAGFAFALAALWFGGTTELIDNGRPDEILRRLGMGDVDGVFMVPTHFSRIFDAGSATMAHADGHRLKAVISNAAALSQPLKEQAIALFGEGLLHESYGSTEAGVVTNIRPSELRAKPGSVGTPFTGVAVELRRSDGTTAAVGEPGELFCQGPAAFSGYWRQPQATAAAVVDGWVTVGDAAVRDGDGFISILDRLKDMVVTGGINVYPREIELILANVPGVREAAVVGLPDREWGERLHAFIVSDDRNGPSEAMLADYCRTRLAGFKTPRGFSFIPELPRNAGGKILKRELREYPL